MPHRSNASVTRLLADRRFRPLFVAQLLGAFNDNLFKNALVLLVTFRGLSLFGLRAEQLVALAGAALIAPFFLFSALAGQLADKYPKARLVRWIKLAEVGIVALAGVGLLLENAALSFGVLFLLGTHAALFGPVKYGILPELLDARRLLAGNALVELGTFLAILLGTVAGGVLIGLGTTGAAWVAAVLLACSIVGWAATRHMPAAPPSAPSLRIDPYLLRSTAALVRLARRERPLWLSILGISWFWLLGSVVLAVLPSLVETTLHGSEGVVTYCLALFAVGIGAGAILAEKLSASRLELGLVPLGSLGVSVFLSDAAIALRAADLTTASPSAPVSVWHFLGTPLGVRLSIDLLAFAVASGLFTVPLYTLLQERSDAGTRSRIIAANNVMNALFMVAGALGLVASFALGVTIPHVLLLCAAVNVGVAVYIYTVIPEFALRFLCYCLAHVLYRLRVRGAEHLPTRGPAVLVANHVTFVDWLIIASATPRPVRFVMDVAYAHPPLVGRLLRDAKVIPIASAKRDPALLEAAFDAISAALKDGELVCIFPEGRLTTDGAVGPFRRGIERILQRDPVPVIPMYLDGLFGSFFSRSPARRAFRRIWSRITLTIGAPLSPVALTACELEAHVRALAPERRAPTPRHEASFA